MNTPKQARFATHFVTRSLVALFLLVLGPIQALAQSPWIITNSSPYSLKEKATNLETEYYRVEQWGFLFTRSTLWHDVYYYPTTELNEAGVFEIDPHNGVSGDFNGDGKKDLMINWSVQPYVSEHPPIAPSVLLNNGSGGLTLSSSAWVNGIGPARLFSYRTGAADFNHDGVDDFVAASNGIQRPDGKGSWISTNEPIPLALSFGDGRLFDATTYIAGQEGGAVVPGFSTSHNLAVGDFNGDGHKDFYQGRFLFLNDGTGHFTPRQDLLPPDAKHPGRFYVSSAFADLDNDGVDDLVVAHAWIPANDPVINPFVSGYIFLSNGTGSITNGRKVSLPPGLFGLENTTPNFTTICDLNRDGLKDIVIAQTRLNPYYRGRAFQVLMNKGNGQFVDESAKRILGDDRRDDLSDGNGEGVLYCLDVNGDGYVDLFDSSGGFAFHSDRAFLNNGRGVFHAVPRSIIPIVQPYHLQGNEDWEGQPFGTSHYNLTPIDLHGDGRVSFFAVHNHIPTRWPQQPGDVSDATYYLIRNIKPYKPVTLRTVGDFDGDGRSDIAVYRNGGWLILRSLDGGVTVLGFGGLAQDVPVPGDYDGDGMTDVAVYRDGVWLIIRSFDGAVTGTGWGGLAQDIPLN